MVSIHAPTRGATHHSSTLGLRESRFQFTHPRGVRLLSGSLSICRWCVSIHAPTRGATIALLDQLHTGEVSIHAPTRGATAPNFLQDVIKPGFNSRTHEGCDTSYETMRHILLCFNSRTHEGCDLFSLFVVLLFIGFNSRTHEGCDLRGCLEPTPLPSVQFTHPRGVRRAPT